MNWLYILNFVLSGGGLVLLLATIVLYVDYYRCESRYYRRFIQPFVWQIILLTTIGSVALSLLYSEYFGFVPCSLCWLQRIALYPQALLAIVANNFKERLYFPLYSIALSIFGLLVAVYHYIYQMIPKGVSGGPLPCLTDGSSDCATKIIDMFGFVTFPFLSAVTFVFLIVLYLNLRRIEKNK